MKSDPIVETVAFVNYTCDHPQCDVVHSAQDGEPPYGFTGTVTYVNAAQERVDSEWFACKHVHVRGAIYALTLKGGRE